MSLSPQDLAHIDAIVARLHQCRRICVITGAGLSADSNLPTYRGIGGLYNEEGTKEGIPIEVALSGQMLAARPEIAWKHIARIEAACRGAVFNRGHAVIAAMERHFGNLWVVTQNVDGFHHAAGSHNVIDIHGNIHELKCTRCSWRDTVADYADLTLPPMCPHCGAVVRPDVVLFGEMLDGKKVALMQEQAFYGYDMVFSVGTSSLFPYIVEPIVAARAGGVPTVEINPGQTELSLMVDHKIAAGAAETLDAIWSRFMASAPDEEAT
jgi:NAD-dependent deacetylase